MCLKFETLLERQNFLWSFGCKCAYLTNATKRECAVKLQWHKIFLFVYLTWWWSAGRKRCDSGRNVSSSISQGLCLPCVCDKFCVCMHTLQLVCDSHSLKVLLSAFSNWLLFVFGNSFQPCIHILCIHVSYYYNVEDNIYLKRSVISTLIHLTPGVSWGGWSVISLLTCSLEHRMMERRSVRAFLKVIEPPMALRVLKRPSNRFLFVLNTQNKSIKKINPPTFQWLHPPHHRIWRVHQCLLPWLLCCPHQSRQLQLSWRAPLSATALSSCWEITLKKR